MKKLFIPIAAFAVTVSGVSAFSGPILSQFDLGLSETQIVALEAAHELRKEGDRAGAMDVLADAGLDHGELIAIREALHEYHHEHHGVVKGAIEAGSFEDFVIAAADTPLGDVIESEADFELLQEAHVLREAGDTAGAKAILKELGIEKSSHGKWNGRPHHGHHHGSWGE